LYRLEEGNYIAFEEERDNFNKDIKVISHNAWLLNRDSNHESFFNFFNRKLNLIMNRKIHDF